QPLFSRQTILCESEDFRRETCRLPAGRVIDVDLVRQVSSADCDEGETWDYNNRTLWVSNGCRAYFEVTLSGGIRPGPRPGPGPGPRPIPQLRETYVTCWSNDERYNRCNVPGLNRSSQ